MVSFLLGAACLWMLPEDVAEFLDGNLPDLPLHDDVKARALLILVSFVVALIAGWLVPRRPQLSRRTLLGSAALAGSAIVIGRLAEMENAPPVWPIVVAGLMFIDLWWLGILMFDLTFVWHRYVREAVSVQVLRCWSPDEDAKPRKLMGFGLEQSALQSGAVQQSGKPGDAKAVQSIATALK
jgi:hypothetical protein